MAQFSNDYKKSKAKSGTKLTLEFTGFNEVVERLKKLDANVPKVCENALVKSKRNVHKKLGTAMQPHNKTFATVRSLTNSNKVEWNGTKCHIDVGFDISKGGLPSIFLMYGTPRMKKDQKLFNAIYGTSTKKEIRKLQEDLFYAELRKLGG